MGRIGGVSFAGVVLLTALLVPAGTTAAENCIEYYAAGSSSSGILVKTCPTEDDPYVQVNGIRVPLIGGGGGGGGGSGLPGWGGMPSFDPQLAMCGTETLGVHVGAFGKGAYTCVDWHARTPTFGSGPGQAGDGGSGDGGTAISNQPCDPHETLRGQIIHINGRRFGACLIYEYALPNDPSDDHVAVDLARCDMPSMNGQDPAIWALGGGVAFCVVWVAEYEGMGVEQPGDPGGLPPVEVDLSPCARDAVDPSVIVGDGGVFICVHYGLHQ